MRRNNQRKWYQSRGIQAALIGAVALLLVPVVERLINVSDNRTNITTNIPARSSVKDILKPRSEPEEEIERVNQSQSELIIKKRELSIQPAETEGEVNEPKKGELKKRETAIAPEENEGEVRKTK